LINLKITSDTLDEVDAQLALIFAYQDIRPLKGQAGRLDWRMNGYLSHLIMKNKFSGKMGEALLMPSAGRVAAKEVLILGLGNSRELSDQNIPHFVSLILEKILRKKDRIFTLTLSDLAQGMFEWRNTVRLFISMLSGKDEKYQVALLEPEELVEDARKRHMDFAYDVQVQYS
jgi:leucyl aminopeptidase